MAHWLNKLICVFLVCVFFGQKIAAQDESVNEYKDYKNKDQFKNYAKRRKLISAWQINQLKNGALVVRLKTNKKQIEALTSQGKLALAKQKAIETFVMNKNTMMAYINNYSFSKLYFILSNSSDSLLKGVRNGIFLDTNLKVDPTINMKESFYLIAERDYAYNSSIGFIYEDSAKFVKETGNPVREMGVIVKNKFGHQLKAPFPYLIKDKTFSDIPVEGIARMTNLPNTYLWFNTEDISQEKKIKQQYSEKGLNNEQTNIYEWMKVSIRKQDMYSKIAIVISQFNASLSEYFQATPPPDLSRMDKETQKFLY